MVTGVFVFGSSGGCIWYVFLTWVTGVCVSVEMNVLVLGDRSICIG